MKTSDFKITVIIFTGLLLTFLLADTMPASRAYAAEKSVPASSKQKPEVFAQLGHSGGVTSVAFSPDGRYALSGGGDKNLKLWDVVSGREIRTFSGNSGSVESVAFSPDSKYALSGTGDNTLKLWDIASGREIRTFKGHAAGPVFSVAFSPDGKYALSGSDDNTLKLWDVTSGVEIRTFSGHTGPVFSVAFTQNGRQALSGSLDNTLKLWDIASGREIRTFSGHSGSVSSVAFSPDGQYALSGGWQDNTLKLWNVASGKEIRTFSGNSGSVNSVAFSPDSKYALSGTGDKILKLWDIASGREIRTFSGHSDRVNSVAFSPDGRQALSGSLDNTLKLWDIASGREIRTFSGHSDRVNSVAFSPDGRQALSGTGDKILKLWDIASGREIRTFSGHSGSVSSVAFSPDGQYALSGGWQDNTLKLWNVASGVEIRTFFGHTDRVNSVVFSPDGRLALSGNHDGTLKLWDIASGREIRTFKGHSDNVNSVAFSPDGKYALSGSGNITSELTNENGTLKLWNVASGEEIRTFSGHSGWVNSVTFSPDGRYALSGGGNLMTDNGIMNLSDIAEGIKIRTFSGHSGLVTSVAFSPDGKHALGGVNLLSDNDLLKLWDVASGEEIRTFSGHSGSVNSVAFSPDGKYALSGSHDGTTRLWDFSNGKEIAQFVGFTDGEWIVITPGGYFNASKNGPAHLNVRMGNSVYGLDQFYDVFYRPDIVEAKLKGEDVSGLAATNLEEALTNPPPYVDFVTIPAESGDKKVTIRYKVSSSGGGIGEIRLFQNGKLIQSDGFYREAKSLPAEKATQLADNSSRAIKEKIRETTRLDREEGLISPIQSPTKGDTYEGSITVEAISGENEIGLAAFNKSNTVQSILKTASFQSTLAPEKANLYILAIGINKYKSTKDNLDFAVADAQSIAKKLEVQSKTIFKPANIIKLPVIKDEEATKSNIINKVNALAGVIKPSDTFVLFISSHGCMKSGLYYIVTHDYMDTLDSSNMISTNEIMEMSKKLKALTQVFILDTCFAGGLDNFISGLYDARMTVMARNMGLHMFASAIKEEPDSYKGEHGLFTYTLLEALNNNRNVHRNKDNKVSISEIGAYAKDKTESYSKGSENPQTPVISDFGKDFTVYLLR